ncbi:uncharacterized protein AMSG_02991 [Thecamonas trahens ATCC 50062]|uniref:Uncharacterized protein n=1 Tax=Thecamonas trahens ATCC 50062 TaxID=461836 RepID=A0A0L0D2Y5_THETB|nr:hypothetical protein AMSG_02991 [Thecamonas trahens ATCC 50062]KNC46556.1 hypothetical protein AMSG_02991 [Thecamonas trahens ATCC 50062]|eukprot:XP_013760335.1 hypothetical protein AMSG_02991 [Thecamonas trahens ATCC 50062]
MTTAQLVQVQALLSGGDPHSAAALGALVAASASRTPFAARTAAVAAAAATAAASAPPLPRVSPWAALSSAPSAPGTTAAASAYTRALSLAGPDASPELLFDAAAAFAAARLWRRAAEALALVPFASRSLAAHLLAGSLSRVLHDAAAARDAYTAALDANAYALDAIDALAELGVPATELKAHLGDALAASPPPRAPASRLRPQGSNNEDDDDDELHWSDSDEDREPAPGSCVPPSWLGLYADAAAAYWSHDFDRAAEAYGSLLSLFPACVAFKRRLAAALWNAGAGHDALAHFAASVDAAPSEPESVDLYALALYEAKDKATLATLANRLLDAAATPSGLWPADPAGELGEPRRAAKAGAPAILVGLAAPQHLVAVAVFFAATDRIATAKKLLERAAVIDPHHATTHIARGRIAMSNTKYSARPSFVAANYARGGSDPTIPPAKGETPRFPHPGVLDGIVAANMAIFEFRGALAAAKCALYLAPESPQSLTLVATVLGSRKEGRAKAESLLLAAIERAPRYHRPLELLVDLYVVDERFDDAIALLRDSLQASVHSAQLLHTLLGEVLTEAGSLNEALVHYHLAVSLDPSSERASLGLERLDALISGDDGDDVTASPPE